GVGRGGTGRRDAEQVVEGVGERAAVVQVAAGVGGDEGLLQARQASAKEADRDATGSGRSIAGNRDVDDRANRSGANEDRAATPELIDVVAIERGVDDAGDAAAGEGTEGDGTTALGSRCNRVVLKGAAGNRGNGAAHGSN